MKKPIGAAGRAAEARMAKRLGYKTVPASGAANGNKGDMYDERFLLEAKSTQSDRYTIKAAELVKINSEAVLSGKLPAFAFQFTDLAGRPQLEVSGAHSWVAVPEWVWKMLQLKEEE